MFSWVGVVVRSQDDPADLITKLSTSLATETPLRARLTTPTLQQKQVGELVCVLQRLKSPWDRASWACIKLLKVASKLRAVDLVGAGCEAMRLKLVPREQVESARGPVNALGFAVRRRGRSVSRKQRRRLARTLRPVRQVSRRVRQLQEQHESELRRRRRRARPETSEDAEIPSAPPRPAAVPVPAAEAAAVEAPEPPVPPPRPKRRWLPPRPAPSAPPGLALRRWRRARGRKALVQQMQAMRGEMKRERRRLVSVLQKPCGYTALATDLQKQGRELKPRFYALAHRVATDRKSQQKKLLEVQMEKEQLAREHLELQLAFAGALEVLRPSALREIDPKSFRCDVKDLPESDFDEFCESDAQDLGVRVGNAADLGESDPKGLAAVDAKDLPLLDDDVLVEVEPEAEHSLPMR